MPWTSDDLVSAVRRRAQLPDSTADGAISDADILELANEEIALRLVPLVRRAREDYFVTYEDQTIVSGTARYRVPERAQASGLRDVTIVTSNGDEYSVPRVSMEDVGDVERSNARTCFVMEAEYVRLVPSPTEGGDTLRMWFHRSHSRLVTVAESVEVFAYLGNITSVAAPPAAYQNAVDNNLFPPAVDLERQVPPFGALVDNAALTAIDDSAAPLHYYTIDLTVPDEFYTPTRPENYFYLTFAGQTPIVSLPRECWPLLISAVTSRVLEVVGDRDAAQLAFALYEREEGNVIELLTPRVEGARKRVIDHFSAFRRGRR